MGAHYGNIDVALAHSFASLGSWGEDVDTGRWQGIATEGKPDLITKEIMNLEWSAQIPDSVGQLQHLTMPNLPWAEAHFQERVGGVPMNPDPSHVDWPWWKGQDDASKTAEGEKFTHTYSERFWPKRAGGDVRLQDEWDPGAPNEGIRYPYGDLRDVVALLYAEPHSRQATLPIFFPEDTGAVHGGRIPCSLHYHFMLRNQKLHCWYAIRSCDAVRHFRDDVYMACRLVQWVLDALKDTELDNAESQPDMRPIWLNADPGFLYFTAYSFHVHHGDMHLLRV